MRAVQLLDWHCCVNFCCNHQSDLGISEWQPTPVFLPGEFHGQRSLAGCSPCSCKEWHTTEQCSLSVCVCMCVSCSFVSVCDPMDCSRPASSVNGILQARTLEWAAIRFSTLSLYIHMYSYRHIYACIHTCSCIGMLQCKSINWTRHIRCLFDTIHLWSPPCLHTGCESALGQPTKVCQF